MKIGNIVNNFRNYRAHKSAVNAEKKIEKYFRIHDTDLAGDSFNQMYNARSGVAEYARQNNVSVDVFNASKYYEEDYDLPRAVQDTSSDKLEVVVTNRKNGKSKKALIGAQTDALYPKESQHHFVVNIEGEDTQITRTGYRHTEDNFLRNFYRCIEVLTQKITGKI